MVSLKACDFRGEVGVERTEKEKLNASLTATGQSQSSRQMLSQQKLVDLMSEVDPKQVLDEDVEEVSSEHYNS